jgi:Ca2+-binding RTX toxin-like protein
MAIFNLNGNEAATGLSDNDTFNLITGSANTALGGEGNDTFNVSSNSFANTLVGGDGNDQFNVGRGVNDISGGNGVDVYKWDFNAGPGFGPAQDTFKGGSGSDWADYRELAQQFGGVGGAYDFSASTVTDANGVATVAGFDIGTLRSVENVVGSDGGGDDFIGGAFNMRFDGYGGDDTAVGGSGNELFLGGEGADNLSGNAGNDTLTGGTWNAAGLYVGGLAANTLNGGTGNDALVAGDGGDLMTVGDGTLDYARLGLGRDTVVADGTSDFVSINRFTAENTAAPGNDADVLRLLASTGIDTFDELLSHSVQYTAGATFGTVITTDNGGVIYLDGVNRATLGANDFIFG